MKFEHVLHLLRSYRTQGGEQILFLLQPSTMESIYNCVVSAGARDCLELGTGHGATTCIIAAALDEIGGGCVTTIDMLVREPIGVRVLAQHVGLTQYIKVIADSVGYNWHLGEMIGRQTVAGVCSPCLDFCFLDGAHEWGVDALASFLVAKLLRPGAWLILDDLDFKLRGCQPGWETVFAGRSDKELDTCQVGQVFNLVLRQHPGFADFIVTDGGRTGWGRRTCDEPPAWQPTGLVLDPAPLDWQQSFSATEALLQAPRSDGIIVRACGTAVEVQATQPDPYFTLVSGVDMELSIDIVSLRLRLMAPAQETLQLYWISGEAQHFTEAQSVRVKVAAADGWQDITVRINGSREPRSVRGLRLDPADGLSSLLCENVAFGGRHRRTPG